jgi:hypothetical protein
MTASSTVTENLETLKSMDHGGLFRFAKEHGFDSRAGFSAFKKALAKSGIDYDAMRQEKTLAKIAAMAHQATRSVTLYCDAKARTDRFAICDKTGAPVWFGKFFDNDGEYDGEQSSGEMAAALKAVWLASKIAEAAGESTVRLKLMVDAEWLTYANNVMDATQGGGKARKLGEAAVRLNVMLEVEWIPGASNPADEFTVCHGFRSYRDTDLRSLAQ